MEYRYLGNSGLQVSVIGLGNMINCKPEDREVNLQIVKKAIEKGVNFIDTAEIYHHGKCETELGWELK